jgi:hypothetical protein
MRTGSLSQEARTYDGDSLNIQVLSLSRSSYLILIQVLLSEGMISPFLIKVLLSEGMIEIGKSSNVWLATGHTAPIAPDDGFNLRSRVQNGTSGSSGRAMSAKTPEEAGATTVD